MTLYNEAKGRRLVLRRHHDGIKTECSGSRVPPVEDSTTYQVAGRKITQVGDASH
jgi:hypothetical protein